MDKTETGVQLSLVVDDLEKAKHFYIDVLGLFIWNENVFVHKDFPEVRILPRKAVEARMSQALGRQTGDFPFLLLYVDNCKAVAERIRQAHPSVQGEFIYLPWGSQFTIRDPFGNNVCLSTTILVDP